MLEKSFPDSSNVRYLTWSKETLTVTFKKGRKYRYTPVSKALYHELCGADSVSSAVNEKIVADTSLSVSKLN